MRAMAPRKCAEQRMGCALLVSVFVHSHAGQARVKLLWTLHGCRDSVYVTRFFSLKYIMPHHE